MTKTGYLVKEMTVLIRKHKLYFISPMLLLLGLIAFLVYYLGPTAIVSFLYAGV